MKRVRPCLECGRDNAPDATACSGCGVELVAHAEIGAGPIRREGLAPLRQKLLVAGLAAVVIAGLGALVVRYGRVSSRAAPVATWRIPPTMVTWAKAELDRRGVPPSAVRATVERRTRSPRRVLVTEHPAEQDLAKVVAEVAGLLVASREQGEPTVTHLAVIEHGSRDTGRTLGLPIGQAARLVADPGEVARLLEISVATEPSGDEAAAVEPQAEEGPRSSTGESAPSAPEDPVAAAGPAEEIPSPPEVAVTSPSEAPVAPAVTPPAVTEPVRAAPVVPEPAVPAVAPPEVSGVDEASPPARRLSPVRMLRGPGPLLPGRVKPGETDVVLLRLQLHPGMRRPLVLESIQLKARGTASDVDAVDSLRLVLDTDRDGRRGPADVELGRRQAFFEDDGAVTFEALATPFGADGLPLFVLALGDFVEQDTGGTFMASVADADAVVVQDVASGGKVPLIGAPLNGSLATLEGSAGAGTGEGSPDGTAGTVEPKDG